eukprot:CAMPEP_0119289920 /NCGR_PEP_ID=MMETSP1329-20130426/39857_1 /TAXON_ID=114041 /ORGANISM="Genus nov. species nov., Strain RCC1024" /LENGTH=40 /DNA_ID= /DNA_START= /DNA_END= /DNA_ORIENTATION=
MQHLLAILCTSAALDVPRRHVIGGLGSSLAKQALPAAPLA